MFKAFVVSVFAGLGFGYALALTISALALGTVSSVILGMIALTGFLVGIINPVVKAVLAYSSLSSGGSSKAS